MSALSYAEAYRSPEQINAAETHAIGPVAADAHLVLVSPECNAPYLSPLQVHAITLRSEGQTTRQIARSLGASFNTVKHAETVAMKKFGVWSKAASESMMISAVRTNGLSRTPGSGMARHFMHAALAANTRQARLFTDLQSLVHSRQKRALVLNHGYHDSDPYCLSVVPSLNL